MSRQPEETDLDEVELGDRAANWLLYDALGAAYSELKDRVWAVALGCYGKCVDALGAENVPPQWKPRTDENGMWHMPGGE